MVARCEKAVKVHYFRDTGEAYDECQCNEQIKNGDILVIKAERVVGLAWTWPVAVTKEHGHLHTLAEGSQYSDLTNYKGERVFTDEQIAQAVRLAGKYA